jgi:prepilin-type N-terminal cleavage/methylation domain-containing protein
MRIPNKAPISRDQTSEVRETARTVARGGVSKQATRFFPGRPERAFTLVEVLLSISVFAVMGVALYGGISFGFATITLARQNLRATQIALEKMEIARMYSWDQINSNGFVPTTFTAPFYPMSGSETNGGLTYYGTTAISAFPKNISYSGDMRQITVHLSWTNRTVPQSLEMSTYISQYGMQRYIY